MRTGICSLVRGLCAILCLGSFVTFVLQELMFGSKRSLSDENLNTRFKLERQTAIALWTDGPYVYNNRHNFLLWRDVVVAEIFADPFFAANSEVGVTFLTENQSPISEVQIDVARHWSLVIRRDGSAHIRYRCAVRLTTTPTALQTPLIFEKLSEELEFTASQSGGNRKEPNFLLSPTRSGGRSSRPVFARYEASRPSVSTSLRMRERSEQRPRATLRNRIR